MSSNAISGSQYSTTNGNTGKIRSVRQMIRAGVELLAHDIEAGHPEVLTDCFKAMARFHTYSLGNQILISTQRPSSTQVAGWRAWHELGHRIKPGEKGIMIFAPILVYPKSDINQANNDTEQSPQLLGFRQVWVWDVEQTESGGDAFPAIKHVINADLGDVLKALAEFAASQDIQIEYSPAISPAKGTSYRSVVCLLPDMEPEETVLTLVRELAVQILYGIERRSFVTRDVLLKEAKAVVFVVGHALGLEWEITNCTRLYQGDTNLLAESLAVVQRTSAIILGAISPRDEHEQEGGN